jgi:hypothetical protein
MRARWRGVGVRQTADLARVNEQEIAALAPLTSKVCDIYGIARRAKLDLFLSRRFGRFVWQVNFHRLCLSWCDARARELGGAEAR